MVAPAKLGCGEHQVFVQERGGGNILAQVEWSTINYGRVLDEISDASVVVGSAGLADERCCWALGNLRAFEHELSIWRDGEEVWVGVITEPVYEAEKVTIPARDLFMWFERRLLPLGRDIVATDLGTIFQTFVDDALSGDTSPDITVVAGHVGVIGDRTNDPTQFQRAADALRELARSGVDFTMIGRTMVVGGEVVPVSDLGIWTGDHLDAPKLTERGLAAATKVVVIGGTDPDANVPIFGEAGGVDATLGLVEATFSEGAILDQNSVEFSAEGHLEMLRIPPVYLDATLLPEAPVSFADLIPGAGVDVRMEVACRNVDDPFRLKSVSVDASAEEGGEPEVVGIVLIPPGATEIGS